MLSANTILSQGHACFIVFSKVPYGYGLSPFMCKTMHLLNFLNITYFNIFYLIITHFPTLYIPLPTTVFRAKPHNAYVAPSGVAENINNHPPLIIVATCKYHQGGREPLPATFLCYPCLCILWPTIFFND